jgi:hypothetical protein
MYILCSFGTFFRFWYHVPRKIWQPWIALENQDKISCENASAARQGHTQTILTTTYIYIYKNFFRFLTDFLGFVAFLIALHALMHSLSVSLTYMFQTDWSQRFVIHTHRVARWQTKNPDLCKFWRVF